VDGGAVTAEQFLGWNAGLAPGRRYFIWGYASYIARLGARLLALGPTARCTPPVAVICSGETLTTTDADTIRAAFGRQPANHYSCWEAPHMAQTCPDNPALLHVNSERVILRVVREDGSRADPGESGRVILTSLRGYAMPFINYEIGDRAVAGEPCNCGRGFPTLGSLDGRTVEVLWTPGGRAITHLMFSRLLNGSFSIVDHVRQYQAEQTAPDALLLRVVPSALYTDEFSHRLRTQVEKTLGPGLRVTVERVDQIPPEPNGKHLALKPYQPISESS
jgi:phenylacetate-CoA ligase